MTRRSPVPLCRMPLDVDRRSVLERAPGSLVHGVVDHEVDWSSAGVVLLAAPDAAWPAPTIRCLRQGAGFRVLHFLVTHMDRQDIQTRVQAFAQRLLLEAKGDPIRALGLLVLVLEGVKTEDMGLVRKLVSEVRRILVPAPAPIVLDSDETPVLEEVPIQHLAGDLSWEGVQHCIRCGKVLARARGDEPDETGGFPIGYVYEVGNKRFLADPHEWTSCRNLCAR